GRERLQDRRGGGEVQEHPLPRGGAHIHPRNAEGNAGLVRQVAEVRSCHFFSLSAGGLTGPKAPQAPSRKIRCRKPNTTCPARDHKPNPAARMSRPEANSPANIATHHTVLKVRC